MPSSHLISIDKTVNYQPLSMSSACWNIFSDTALVCLVTETRHLNNCFWYYHETNSLRFRRYVRVLLHHRHNKFTWQEVWESWVVQMYFVLTVRQFVWNVTDCKFIWNYSVWIIQCPSVTYDSLIRRLINMMNVFVLMSSVHMFISIKCPYHIAGPSPTFPYELLYKRIFSVSAHYLSLISGCPFSYIVSIRKHLLLIFW